MKSVKTAIHSNTATNRRKILLISSLQCCYECCYEFHSNKKSCNLLVYS